MHRGSLIRSQKLRANPHGSWVFGGGQHNSVTESIESSETTIRIYGNVALFNGITDLRDCRPVAIELEPHNQLYKTQLQQLGGA
jgi:hypothetical protein